MFVTLNQFYVFIVALSSGVICGIPVALSYDIKKASGNVIIGIFTDVTAFVLVTAIYVVLSYIFNFPSLRFYMIVGVFAGMYIYFKSFHILLAKILNKPYNIIKKVIKRAIQNAKERKKIRKRTKNDGSKVQKNSIGINGGRRIVGSHTFVDNGVSVNIHRRQA